MGQVLRRTSALESILRGAYAAAFYLPWFTNYPYAEDPAEWQPIEPYGSGGDEAEVAMFEFGVFDHGVSNHPPASWKQSEDGFVVLRGEAEFDWNNVTFTLPAPVLTLPVPALSLHATGYAPGAYIYGNGAVNPAGLMFDPFGAGTTLYAAAEELTRTGSGTWSLLLGGLAWPMDESYEDA